MVDTPTHSPLPHGRAANGRDTACGNHHLCALTPTHKLTQMSKVSPSTSWLSWLQTPLVCSGFVSSSQVNTTLSYTIQSVKLRGAGKDHIRWTVSMDRNISKAPLFRKPEYDPSMLCFTFKHMLSMLQMPCCKVFVSWDSYSRYWPSTFSCELNSTLYGVYVL